MEPFSHHIAQYIWVVIALAGKVSTLVSSALLQYQKEVSVLEVFSVTVTKNFFCDYYFLISCSMNCKYKMFVFSSLDFYFRLAKCKLVGKNPTKQTQTTHCFSFGTFSQSNRDIIVQLQLSLFLHFHREKIWMRDGKSKINLVTVTFNFFRSSKSIIRALNPQGNTMKL